MTTMISQPLNWIIPGPAMTIKQLGSKKPFAQPFKVFFGPEMQALQNFGDMMPAPVTPPLSTPVAAAKTVAPPVVPGTEAMPPGAAQHEAQIAEQRRRYRNSLGGSGGTASPPVGQKTLIGQ